MSSYWTAKCWLGQASGYVDLTVQATTFNGAQEQLRNVYGAQQIINLRQTNPPGRPEKQDGHYIIYEGDSETTASMKAFSNLFTLLGNVLAPLLRSLMTKAINSRRGR